MKYDNKMNRLSLLAEHRNGRQYMKGHSHLVIEKIVSYVS